MMNFPSINENAFDLMKLDGKRTTGYNILSQSLLKQLHILLADTTRR